MKGKLDMGATTASSSVSYNLITVSDAEVVETIHKEK